MTDELYHYHGGELYHYGIPGMKWGVRKAKLQTKAESYRKAASTTTNELKKNKYLDKADALDSKAAALDTKKGRIIHNVKKGAAITAGILATVGALKIASNVGWNTGFDDGWDSGSKKGVKETMSYMKDQMNFAISTDGKRARLADFKDWIFDKNPGY